jgi:Flp pilus assembly protein TadG
VSRARSACRRLTRRLAADRGSSAIELAILAPALLILALIIIQFALWFQARQAALAAAQEGARIARQIAANDARWQDQADARTVSYYNGLGTKILTGVTATAVTGNGPDGTPLVGVTVTGRLNSLLNAVGGMTITVTVEGPEECFHPQGSGGACAG